MVKQYCGRMREDGTWGGNQELYAAARLFQVYVVVHMESSRMVIECDAHQPKRVLHVAYHGSDHYDSVRLLKESDEQAHSGAPPMEIELDCDGFRPDDLAKVRASSVGGIHSRVSSLLTCLPVPLWSMKRWQARGSDSANQQRITAEVGVDGDKDVADSSLASQLKDLKLSAESGTPVSKKAQRQLRKQAVAASKRGAKQKKK